MPAPPSVAELDRSYNDIFAEDEELPPAPAAGASGGSQPSGDERRAQQEVMAEDTAKAAAAEQPDADPQRIRALYELISDYAYDISKMRNNIAEMSGVPGSEQAISDKEAQTAKLENAGSVCAAVQDHPALWTTT